jgi:hypothetical protein
MSRAGPYGKDPVAPSAPGRGAVSDGFQAMSLTTLKGVDLGMGNMAARPLLPSQDQVDMAGLGSCKHHVGMT